MAMQEPDSLQTFLETLLGFQVGPALLLSDSRRVIAANESGLRLISGTANRHVASFDNELVGQTVTDLNIILTPGCKPVYRDWNAIFKATHHDAEEASTKSRSDFGDDIPTGDEDEDARTMRYNKDLAQDTELFWIDEYQRHPPKAESDVIVLSQLSDDDATTDRKRDRAGTRRSVKARLTLSYWYKQGHEFYLVLFRRSEEVATSTLEDAKKYAGFIKPIHHDNITTAATEAEKNATEQMKESKSPAQYDLSTPEDVEIQNQLIPHIMAILSPEGQAMCFSDSWYQFCGLTEAESVGSGWAAVIHPDDVKAVTESWAKVIMGDIGHWTWEVRYRRADGVYIWFIIRAQPYKDKNGKTLRWYASMLDINSWVQARLQSDHRNESMLKLLSQADVSLWGIDQDRIIYIREGHLNWDPAAIINLVKTCSPTSSTSDHTAAPLNTHGRIQAGALAQVVCEALKGNDFPSAFEHEEDDRFFRTRLVADLRGEHDNNGENMTKAILALTYEITDIKKRATLELDNERLAMNEKSAKDASNLKSSFLANMSHEIRTPIAGIIGLTEHLSDLNLNKEQQEFSDTIRESAKFLLSLVNDVLDFSKIESGHMDIEAIVFAPLKLVHDIFTIMNQQAVEKGLSLDLHTNLPPDTLVVGDPGRVRQILTNLIGNSIKFTDKGHVSLTIEAAAPNLTTPKDERILDFQMDSSMTYESKTTTAFDHRVNLRFTVKDTGMGIDAEAMKHLFRPFSQADTSTARTHGGSGLGLVICRQLVGLMEGRIALESTIGSGTVAVFNIPFYEYDEKIHGADGQSTKALSPVDSPSMTSMDWESPINDQSADQSHPPRREWDWQHLHMPRQLHLRPSSQRKLSPEERAQLLVLVVEDNPVNRKIICLSVTKLGYSVSAVSNGQEALDYLARENSRQRPDAILMDCMMPICDGYQATSKIRADHEAFDDDVRSVPIIALTASAIKGDREKCQAAGMNDYLKKPVARDTLERSLLKWLTARR